MPGDYFEELAEQLRARGVDEERVDATIAELTDYAAESGGDPRGEFGPAPEFAERLAATGAAAEPESESEHWVWTADAYVDQDMMNKFGAQGWEIERVDKLGRFVSHRPHGGTLRWEYRRDVVDRRKRDAHAASLAPDGWEPCGNWMYLTYYKRPVAAVDGPAAQLTDPPEPPRRSVYFTRELYVPLGVSAALLVLSGVLIALGSGFSGSDSFRSGTLVGMACGAVGGVAVAVVVYRRQRDEFRRASRFPPAD